MSAVLVVRGTTEAPGEDHVTPDPRSPKTYTLHSSGGSDSGPKRTPHTQDGPSQPLSFPTWGAGARCLLGQQPHQGQGCREAGPTVVWGLPSQAPSGPLTPPAPVSPGPPPSPEHPARNQLRPFMPTRGAYHPQYTRMPGSLSSWEPQWGVHGGHPGRPQGPPPGEDEGPRPDAPTGGILLPPLPPKGRSRESQSSSEFLLKFPRQHD